MVTVQWLCNYDRKVRLRYLEKLMQLPWSELIKNREASHHSIRNITLHSLFVMYRLIEHVIQEKEIDQMDFDAYDSPEKFKEYMKRVDDLIEGFMSTLTDSEVGRMVQFRRMDGSVTLMTVEEVLLQAFTEQMYHRGEIIALLWQMGVEPPPMQWFLNRPNT